MIKKLHDLQSLDHVAQCDECYKNSILAITTYKAQARFKKDSRSEQKCIHLLEIIKTARKIYLNQDCNELGEKLEIGT